MTHLFEGTTVPLETHDLADNLEELLHIDGLRNGLKVYKFSAEVAVEPIVAYALAETNGLHCVSEYSLRKGSASVLNTAYWLSSNSNVVFRARFNTDNVSVSLVSTDKHTFDQLVTAVLQWPREGEGIKVYTLLPSRSGLELRRLGNITSRANADYYNDKTWVEYTDWLKTYPKAKARLSIFSGPAGVGKTHLIYEAINCDENTAFIFTDATTFQHNHKNITAALLDNGYSSPDADIEDAPGRVLVIEDGDQLIAKRDDNNRAAVEFLLNMTDGILAEALNLRVIVTTNLELKDIDLAISRPGRCHKILNVGALLPEKFHKIAGKLSSGTLAEALNLKAKTPVVKPKIGFGS